MQNQSVSNENCSENFDSAVKVSKQKLLANIFAFYGTLNKNGSLIELNGSIFERTSVDPSLLTGRKFSETVFWQSSEQTPKMLETAIRDAAKGLNAKTLLDFRLSSEQKLFVELHLFPSDETADEIFFCAYDVTGQEKQIEYHRQRGEQLLFAAESAEIGLWSWDLNDNTVYSTPRCNEIFGVSPYQKLEYEDVVRSLHSSDRQRVEEILEHSQQNGTEYHEKFRVNYSDGHTEWISANGKTFLDERGHPQKMMGVVCNITDQKKAEEELAKIYDSEKKARDEAEEANRSKDFFLAFVSHELRSPLNAILGWSKILLTKEVDEKTAKNALETIERSARAQAKLIDDLVDSARIASGKLRLEFLPANLYDILQSVYHTQKPAADAKKINFELNADQEKVSIIADTVRLQQIFNNLISNSLKFTPDGGSVKISLEVSANQAAVTVTDDGQGINPEAMPFIFRQFAQANEDEKLNRQGLGLGLSIVKTLVEKHNGTVRAESGGIGQGTTFTVLLPLASSVEKRQAKEHPTIPGGKPLQNIEILLIEDDDDSREVLQIFLEQNGAEVISTNSAKDALNVLAERRNELPAVLISDVAMPVEDGFSMISRLRQLPENQGGKIPAIALSAFAARENKQKSFESGFQKYVTKPFDFDLIIKEILDLTKKS